MSEATSAGDELDRANAAFWLGGDVRARLEHIEPFSSEESFAIADLSDDEWRDFLAAVRG